MGKICSYVIFDVFVRVKGGWHANSSWSWCSHTLAAGLGRCAIRLEQLHHHAAALLATARHSTAINLN